MTQLGHRNYETQLLFPNYNFAGYINRNPPSVPIIMGTNFHKFSTEKWFEIGRNGLHGCVGVR